MQSSDKSSESSTPLISIITVVLNGEKHLEETLQSVITQDFRDFELIVIDGRSTDGTHAIIEKYSRYIDQYLSEKDKGIYDAMNKGIRLANGEWLYFLNVGDTLKQGVLAKIFNDPPKDTDFIYGQVETKNDPSGVDRIVGSPLQPGSFYFSIPISHQAAFIRKKLFDEFGLYDISYKILADQEWFIRFFQKKDHRATFVPVAIADYEIVGYSYLNRVRSLKEALRNSRRNFPLHISLANHMLFPLKYMKVNMIKLLKNTRVYQEYRKFRYAGRQQD